MGREIIKAKREEFLDYLRKKGLDVVPEAKNRLIRDQKGNVLIVNETERWVIRSKELEWCVGVLYAEDPRSTTSVENQKWLYGAYNHALSCRENKPLQALLAEIEEHVPYEEGA